MDLGNLGSMFSSLLGVKPPEVHSTETNSTPAVQTESKAPTQFSREDIRAVLADPEVTKAIKQASKDGMKEGYVELMKKFMTKLPQLLVPILSIGSGTDPIAAFKNFTDGLINAFDDITGAKTTVIENPQTVLEGKPATEASPQADAMKTLFAQMLKQAQPAAAQ